MTQKPSIPKGTRDFSPLEMAKRNYIFDTIKKVFLLYGFQQIETPAMENLSTLMGKYGEEGDKLLFKILNSGDYLKNVSDDLLENRDHIKLINKISEKGLRYDLTVPFARFVVQHRNDIQLPFKRYQIQPVWRADRPQKGRYREFYQCDADVVGSDSLYNEIELLSIINAVFEEFGVSVTIKINNRKILSGIAEVIGAADKLIDITVAIDKLDKIGIDNVELELKEKDLTDEQISKLQPLLELHGSNEECISSLKSLFDGCETGLAGVKETEFILNEVSKLGFTSKVELDTSLARGLNYYTGTILEVKANDVEIGSISGGGRYDNLTGVFGMPGLSGVGISFGADRIFDVLNALDLYPDEVLSTTKVMFVNFGVAEANKVLEYLSVLRANGIACELYPDASKMKKQMNYANERKIPFVALVGESELESGTVAVRNMESGEQENLTVNQMVERLKD